MEKLDIIMWAVGGGFAGTWSLFLIMFKKFDRIDRQFDKVDQKFDKVDQKFEKIESRLERMEDKINDVDKRLVAVEIFLHMKECCVLKDDRIKKKAE